eukprot:Filipodium_phascolosomae@DN1839_c0_g1_i4.p1
MKLLTRKSVTPATSARRFFSRTSYFYQVDASELISLQSPNLEHSLRYMWAGPANGKVRIPLCESPKSTTTTSSHTTQLQSWNKSPRSEVESDQENGQEPKNQENGDEPKNEATPVEFELTQTEFEPTQTGSTAETNDKTITRSRPRFATQQSFGLGRREETDSSKCRCANSENMSIFFGRNSGCRGSIKRQRYITRPPKVFGLSLEWESLKSHENDIYELLSRIPPALRLGKIFSAMVFVADRPFPSVSEVCLPQRALHPTSVMPSSHDASMCQRTILSPKEPFNVPAKPNITGAEAKSPKREKTEISGATGKSSAGPEAHPSKQLGNESREPPRHIRNESRAETLKTSKRPIADKLKQLFMGNEPKPPQKHSGPAPPVLPVKSRTISSVTMVKNRTISDTKPNEKKENVVKADPFIKYPNDVEICQHLHDDPLQPAERWMPHNVCEYQERIYCAESANVAMRKQLETDRKTRSTTPIKSRSCTFDLSQANRVAKCYPFR